MILVTGGTGLVGSHLLLQLVKDNSFVKAIYRDVNSIENTKRVFSYYLTNAEHYLKRILWVQADINDLPALDAAFEDVELVYHCAALISFEPSDFYLLRKINAEGTANIVNMGITHSVRKLCYVSSIATIAKPVSGGMASEEEYGPDRRTNVYAISKNAAEMEVWRGSQEGLPVVIVNPGIILGPGFWKSGSGKIFRIAAKGYRFSPPGATGFIGVNDLVNIMVGLMNSTLSNERFIAIAQNMSYKELLIQITREMKIKSPVKTIPFWWLELLWRLDWIRCLITGGRRKLTKNSVESFKNPVTYSNAKIRKALGYQFEPLSEFIPFCSEKFLIEHPHLVR